MSLSLIVFLVIFAVLFLLNIPIAFVLLISSTIYLIANGHDISLVVQSTISGMNDFLLLAIPFFILAAELLNKAGISERIFNFADSFVGRVHGGMAHTNVLSSVVFSGMSGSSSADAAGLGTMLIRSMEKKGFDRPFSAAVTASSSVIGPIIPPSVPMVLYSSIAGVSVGQIFLAGVIPGILTAIALMVVCYIIARKRKYPLASEPFSFKNVLVTFKQAFFGLMAPVILLGGIYSGFFTPTEAAVVAVVYAFMVGLLIYKKIGLKDLKEVLMNTAVNTAIVGILIGAASLFAWVLTIENIPNQLSSLFIALDTSPWVFLLIVNILLLILGLFMEINAIMLITVPILLPVIQFLEIDPVHFGVIVVVNLMVATLTPPFGMITLLVSGIANVPIERMLRELTPFFVVLVVVLIMVTYIPQVPMFLPEMLMSD
ncbi:TRAP transporter large permease [Virgibacillus sp. CBA3643]|uniref:TRAP transporter large permease n=1 Tax=Virgibacillus sp. CBA3643 TaxID=2942278 RepID=UPI0035A35643